MSIFSLNFKAFTKLSAKILNSLVDKFTEHSARKDAAFVDPGIQYEHHAKAIRYGDIDLEQALLNRSTIELDDTKCATIVISANSADADDGFQADVANVQRVLNNALQIAPSGSRVLLRNNTYTFSGALDAAVPAGEIPIEIMGESKFDTILVCSAAINNIITSPFVKFSNLTFQQSAGTNFIYLAGYPFDILFENCIFKFTGGAGNMLYFWGSSTLPYVAGLWNRIIFKDCKFIDSRGTSANALIKCLRDPIPAKLVFIGCTYENSAAVPFITFQSTSASGSGGFNTDTNNDRATCCRVFNCDINCAGGGIPFDVGSGNIHVYMEMMNTRIKTSGVSAIYGTMLAHRFYNNYFEIASYPCNATPGGAARLETGVHFNNIYSKAILLGSNNSVVQYGNIITQTYRNMSGATNDEMFLSGDLKF